MRDAALIADALATAHGRGEAVVLATVVRTEGSTYRRAGARAVLAPGGAAVGAVSGGCLEADLAARVGELIAAGLPELVTYDARAGDDLVWGLGLGCNGRVDVLLEPLAGDSLAHALALHARCRDLDAPAVLATVVDVSSAESAALRLGDRLLVDADGEPEAFGLAPDAAPGALVADAREALDLRRSTVRAYDVAGAGRVEVLHEFVAPALRLLVCGAGADAVPLVRLAVGLGWRVSVADHRPDHARADRFPGARVVLHEREAPAVARLPGGACDAAVVMSHNYERDALQVRALLAAGVPYVGVLGPRRRTERMLADLALGDDDRARLFAPVGLDLGAETPEEIALAVVAEVQAVAAGRPGGSLRARSGPIHDPGGA